MTRVNNPTDDLQRVTYPRCLPPRIHYLLSRHTYVRNRLRTPFVSILSLRLVSIAARPKIPTIILSKERTRLNVQNPVQRSFVLSLLEIDQRIGFLLLPYLIFPMKRSSFEKRSFRTHAREDEDRSDSSKRNLQKRDIGLEKMIIRARFYTQIMVKQKRGVCTGQFCGQTRRVPPNESLRVPRSPFRLGVNQRSLRCHYIM